MIEYLYYNDDHVFKTGYNLMVLIVTLLFSQEIHSSQEAMRFMHKEIKTRMKLNGFSCSDIVFI